MTEKACITPEAWSYELVQPTGECGPEYLVRSAEQEPTVVCRVGGGHCVQRDTSAAEKDKRVAADAKFIAAAPMMAIACICAYSLLDLLYYCSPARSVADRLEMLDAIVRHATKPVEGEIALLTLALKSAGVPLPQTLPGMRIKARSENRSGPEARNRQGGRKSKRTRRS